jgi:Aminoglycoside N3''-acetyltransferase
MDQREQLNHIAEDLLSLGVCRGDLLLVHASLSSLGRVEGGARTVVEALLRAIGSGGTLLMPALSYATVNTANPYFSVKETPGCVGVIPEYFRKMQGTYRSLHPTHSICAKGALAKKLVCAHGLDDTPVGNHSPLSLLAQCEGKILMLGCGLYPNTSMHGAEEVTRPPYLFRKEKTAYIVTDAENQKRQAEYRCHDFTGYAQRYDRIANILSRSELKQGFVLNAECFLINAAAMRERAVRVLNEQPLYFVDKIAE